MKKLITISLVFLTLFYSVSLRAQDSCVVKSKNLQGHYEGDCKNGLAHGQGTAIGTDTFRGDWKKGLPDGHGKYSWATGETFEGEWRKGIKNGFGVFHFQFNGKDTIIIGVWENDIYKGKHVKAPEIRQSYNIDKYDIKNASLYKNRVLFDFWQNGMRNSSIEDLKIIADNGTLTQSGSLAGFDNIVFPVTLTVRYTSYNKMHTSKINATFEITIYEAGDWEIKLYN